MRLTEIARLVGGKVADGGDAEILRLAKIEEAVPGDITFLSNPRYRKFAATTRASALLVSADVSLERELRDRPAPLHLVAVKDPYLAFLKLIDTFYPAPPPLPAGVHPTAIVATSAVIGPGAAIGEYAVIGERCMIGRSASIHAGTILGNDVTVGDGSTLYQRVVVREGCRIGHRVIIHPGAVIGADGFGFAPAEGGTFEKIPQRGIVVLEDDVEVGANCTIDRATLGETTIRRGAKLDNLIQIAHNVTVGEDTVIAAQTGVSGSTRIGKNCMIGGQVGFVGHIEIADRTVVGAQSGIPGSITEPGKTYFGYPARELRESLRIQAVVHQLPALLQDIRQLQKRIEELEKQLTNH